MRISYRKGIRKFIYEQMRGWMLYYGAQIDTGREEGWWREYREGELKLRDL